MNYITPVSIYGLMNKNCFIDLDSSSRSFWKTKSKSKLVKLVSGLDLEVFSSNHPEIKQINFMYLDSSPEIKGEYSMDQIESVIDSSFLQGNINRHNHKDIFESIQKYKKLVYVVNDFEVVKKRHDDILQMIEEWRYSQKGGMKFGWQEHAGIDKACIKKYIEDEDFRRKVELYLFIEKSTNKIIGYSMVEKKIYTNKDILTIDKEDFSEAIYLVRKCLVEGRRNITEYIDWWTFNETMKKNNLEKMIVNWGCSSGGVHWYKTHKWPVYKLEKKWFYSWKR